MKYYNTNNRSAKTSFRQVVLNGLAPDGRLYMPEEIPVLKKEFLSRRNLSLHETGFEVAEKFIGDEISKNNLQDIVSKSLSFIIPVFPLEETTFMMELFHGPTFAFKDVGARFMAQMLSHFAKNENKEIVILTATSGDTGSAAASAFYEAEGIRVVILYPEKGVSEIQEKQMTTPGKNITALSVKGTFDDCQSLVKRSFADAELKKKLSLTSANSINIARLIPQTFYFLYARSFFLQKEKVVFSVPSGNFGNLTAGLLAKRMGMNAQFVAATNCNDVFPKYIQNGSFNPMRSVKTISNAMDVGNPSNFARMLSLYDNSLEEMRKDISSYSISDEETITVMKKIFSEKKYVLDPHSAVAFAAWKKFGSKAEEASGIVLATAHPAKFREVVEDATGVNMPLPDALNECLKKEKSARKIPADFTSLKELLMSN